MLQTQQTRLSPRERQVLSLRARGVAPKAIARQLGLSLRRVGQLQEAAQRKLGAADLVNTVALAVASGEIVPTGTPS